MRNFLLDTSAVLTLRDDEPGADRVAKLLAGQQTKKWRVYACFFTSFEILYRVWKDEGEAAGRLAHAQCLALPLEWVEFSDELLLASARLKATAAISVADAWIAAAAVQAGATLVHKDPELSALKLTQEALPFK